MKTSAWVLACKSANTFLPPNYILNVRIKIHCNIDTTPRLNSYLYRINPLLIVAQDRDLADQIFRTRYFVRTLSYREFVTSLSLALLLLACFQIVDYYSN